MKKRKKMKMDNNRVRPCDNCGGKIGPTFYIVKIAAAVVDYAAANRFMALSSYFGGNDKLADVFSPDSTLHTVVEGNDANKWQEIILCVGCYIANIVLHMPEKDDVS